MGKRHHASNPTANHAVGMVGRFDTEEMRRRAEAREADDRARNERIRRAREQQDTTNDGSAR